MNARNRATLLALALLYPALACAQPTPAIPEPVTIPSKPVPGTHSCADYYPADSRFKDESGDVLIGYDVGADGAIGNVHVLKSSGSAALDGAAVECVTEHWRNTPARRGTTPVASSDHEAMIRFTLHGDGATPPSPPPPPPVADEGVSNTVWIIAGVALAALLALGVFLFARRRR